MATWTDTTTMDTAPDAPVASELMTALRDNPVAIAEGAVGATPLAGAYELLEIQEPTADVTAVVFSADLSDYYSICVDFYAMPRTGAPTFKAEIGTAGGTWRGDMGLTGQSSGTSRVRAFYHNINDQDNTGLVGGEAIGTNYGGSYRRVTGVDVSVQIVNPYYTALFLTIPGPYTQARVVCSTSTGIEGTDAEKRGVFKLYGSKALTRQPTS